MLPESLASIALALDTNVARSELRIMDEWREQALHGGRQTVVDPARALASVRG